MAVSELKEFERLSTGVKELDAMIDGGYPKNRTILISGGPGVGKTIIALQFIDSTCRQGLKCLYLATEETPEELEMQANQLGLPISDYRERVPLDCSGPGGKDV